VTLEHGDLSDLRCLRCGRELELIQPDPLRPDRLLACCQSGVKSCGRWHLIDSSSPGPSALVVLLPDPETIRKSGARVVSDHLQATFRAH
jgi:hypothetical protein